MLMKAEPVALAIESLGAADAVVFTDPTGLTFRQGDAQRLALLKHVCVRLRPLRKASTTASVGN